MVNNEGAVFPAPSYNKSSLSLIYSPTLDR